MQWRVMKREQWFAAAGVVSALVLWEAAGRIFPGVRDLIATPSLIVAQYRSDAELYFPHILSTVRSASLGFLIGNGVAIVAAIMFCRFPALEYALHGVNIALFAMPAIVVGPVLAIILSGNLPQIVLSALVVYFPTMSAALVGLRDIDPRLPDIVRTYGGDSNAILRFVRLRSALPAILAGLRSAAPLSVLGAMLGEFGSGVRWGLGSFLLGSLGEADPARLLGIGFAATAAALAGYAFFAWIGRRITGATAAVTITAESAPDEISTAAQSSRLRRLALFAVALIMPFLLWWLVLRVSHISSIIAPGPVETLRYLLTDPESADARAALWSALGETLPVTALGLVFGILAAFLFAALTVIRPAAAAVIMPAAMLLQSMPLIALIPLVLLLFGRDTTASVVISVLVVFFPAFVLLAQGFALVPRAARELVQLYGGGRGKELRLVSVPYSAPYVFSAAKLVAPRALLGVMVAEWLLSGRGLGNLLNASRGLLDYDMVWAGAVISILIAVLAYEAISLIEMMIRQIR
jgi:ABC-type nitrate/sulfonate/bicarbonate transport system permease component